MSKFLEKIKQQIPAPKMMRFDHAGFDIGSDHIRYIFLEKVDNTTYVKSYGTAKIPHTIDKSLGISDNQEVIDILKKIQKENRYKYVEVSLPEELAYIYSQEVEGDDDISIRSQIEFKIEENVPLKPEEAVFDYVKVKDVDNNKKLITVSVVSEKVIDDYIKIFEKANMQIVSFLVQNQVLSKSLISKDDTNSYCIVAIEKKYTVVSIVSAGMVLYTSTISKTLFDDELNLQRKEILEEVIKDIYRILIYWTSYTENNKQYGFDKIKSIIISSTHSNIIESDFINMMINKLAIQIDKPNVWINAIDLNKEIPPINKLDSYQYATAIGLALPKLK